MNDLGQLTEHHRFILLLLAQVGSLVSMLLLYHSTPKKKAPNDGSDPTLPPTDDGHPSQPS